MRKILRTTALTLSLALIFGGVFAQREIAKPKSDQIVKAKTVQPSSKLPTTMVESFEDYDDFTTDLTPWTTLQVTEGDTWSASDFDFTGEGTAFAFMVFNPSQTDPAINDTHPAQEGSKYAVAVQYTSTNDNKWLISPKMMGTATTALSFYAKSMTDAYGLERIKVMISTTDMEPASFTKISDGDYLEVPTTWTMYDYDLSDLEGQEFYFAINYVSYDAFFCMFDNFVVEGESSGYDVTFNVDLTGVEGFDPEADKVYVTGSFTGWAQPGTEGSIEMSLVDKGKEATEVYYEDFADAMPEDWTNVVVAGPAGWAWTNEGGAYGGQLASTTAANGYMILDSDGMGDGSDEEANLISPAIDLSDATSEIMFSIEHAARTYGFAECRIYVTVDDFVNQTMIYEWKDAEQHAWNTEDGEAPDPVVIVFESDITEIAAGQSAVKFKFNWKGAYDYWWLIDDVKIMAVTGGGSDELIYTTTATIAEAGEIQYKYFKNAGWDGGEWAGDPNRVVNVEGAMTINDVWGIPTSADEITNEKGTNLFPNPASFELNVAHSSRMSEIRVFDITGRMVYTTPVNGLTTTRVDLSNFTEGVYILQVIAQDGITSKKFVVRK